MRLREIVYAEKERMEKRSRKHCDFIAAVHAFHSFLLVYRGESIIKPLVFVLPVFGYLHEVQPSPGHVKRGTDSHCDEPRDKSREKIDFDLGFVINAFVHPKISQLPARNLYKIISFLGNWNEKIGIGANKKEC